MTRQHATQFLINLLVGVQVRRQVCCTSHEGLGRLDRRFGLHRSRLFQAEGR